MDGGRKREGRDGAGKRDVNSWAKSLGCPVSIDASALKALGRGRVKEYMDMLMDSVRPIAQVDHVKHTLAMHEPGVRPPTPETPRERDLGKLREQYQAMRRSLQVTCREIDHQNQAQSALDDELRRLRISTLALNRSCDAANRTHVDGMGQCSERTRRFGRTDASAVVPGSAGPVLQMDAEGHLKAHDPITNGVNEIFNQFREAISMGNSDAILAPGGASVDPITLGPSSDILVPIVCMVENDIARLSSTDHRTHIDVLGDIPQAPVETLQQLMEQSRSKHLARFSSTLAALNSADAIEQQLAEVPARLGKAQEYARLRAQVDRLREHIARLEQETVKAHAQSERLTSCRQLTEQLDEDKRQMHTLITGVIKSNRQLRSRLRQSQHQGAQIRTSSIEPHLHEIDQIAAKIEHTFQGEMQVVLGSIARVRWPLTGTAARPWGAVANALRMGASTSPDPIPILRAIIDLHDLLIANRLVSVIEGAPIIPALPNSNELKEQCDALTDHICTDLLADRLDRVQQTLTNAERLAEEQTAILSDWWDQPAQYLVPNERRHGLSISEWIQRRRKMVAELKLRQEAIALRP